MSRKRGRRKSRYGRAYSLATCDGCRLTYKADTVRPYMVYGWQGSIFGTDVLLCEECAVARGLKKPKPKGFRPNKGKPKPDDGRPAPAGRPYNLSTPNTRKGKRFKRQRG